MKNLILIGMPGSGKTKVGKALSALLEMPFLDMDHMIVEEQGRPVTEIFATDGEAAFRDMETAAARKAGAMDGVIVATGGGTVLREENMAALKQSGIVFFRDRALSDIAGEDHSGRPLLKGGVEKLERLYTERIALYEKYADHIISDTKTVQEAAEKIAALYREECKQ